MTNNQSKVWQSAKKYTGKRGTNENYAHEFIAL
jgi:uncharacterized protein (DUF1800 family)